MHVCAVMWTSAFDIEQSYTLNETVRTHMYNIRIKNATREIENTRSPDDDHVRLFLVMTRILRQHVFSLNLET